MATQIIKYRSEAKPKQAQRSSSTDRIHGKRWLSLAIILAPFVYLFWKESLSPISMAGHIELELVLIVFLYASLFIWLNLDLD